LSREHNIGSQLEALRAYAAKNGMEVVEEFTDEGYSGARLDRPALDRMRDLAERRRFEVLLTYCTDRLARKFVLQALILDELERFGVKTIFLEGGAADPLSKLMRQITAAVAEFERAKITERYRRGKLYRARCGEIVSPDVPFGYVKIPRRDGVPAHAEIQEAEAVVVRKIFDAYVSRDLTVRQIAKQFTLDRTPTPRNSGQWSQHPAPAAHANARAKSVQPKFDLRSTCRLMCRVTLIEDLGMRKLPATAAEDLLEIVMRRYERTGPLLTSNRLCGAPHNLFNAARIVMWTPVSESPHLQLS